MTMRVVVAGLLLAGAGAAMAQGGTPQPGRTERAGSVMPTPAYPFSMMGRWWMDPGMVAAVGLRPDQVAKFDKLLSDNREQMTVLHKQIAQTQKDLQALLDAPTLDASRAQMISDQLADEQEALQKNFSRVLLAEREELTADQWAKLKAAHPHEGMRGGHGEMHGKPGGSPDGPPPSQP